MKKVLPLFILLLIITPGILFSNSDHGSIIKLYYSPVGFGDYTIPYDKDRNSIQTIGSKASETKDGESPLLTLWGFSLSASYYYDFLLAEISYSRYSVYDKFIIQEDSGVLLEITSPAVLNKFDIKSGIRFSTYGDRTYKLLYGGFEFINFDTEYNNTVSKGLGFFVGFQLFKCYEFTDNFDFVLSYNLRIGRYITSASTITSDVDFDVKEKFTVHSGASIGMGIYYEPYNITLMIKTAIDYNVFQYSNDEYALNNDFLGIQIGFEIIYILPFYKYNQL